MKHAWMALGIALWGGGLLAMGCGSSVASGGSDNSGSASSSSSGSAGAGGMGAHGGSGGEAGANPTGGGGMGTTGGGGGAAGSPGYASCDECTSTKGAEMNECIAEYMACMEYKTCVSIYMCNTNGTPGGGGPGPCDKSTVKGACCSVECEGVLNDPEGTARYRALDACIHCKTCGSLCNTTTTYCSVFEPNGEMLCKQP